MAHDCPFPPCTRRVNDAYLACRAHWAMLPRALREAIYATVNDADRAEYFEHVMEARRIWADRAASTEAAGG